MQSDNYVTQIIQADYIFIHGKLFDSHTRVSCSIEICFVDRKICLISLTWKIVEIFNWIKFWYLIKKGQRNEIILEVRGGGSKWNFYERFLSCSSNIKQSKVVTWLPRGSHMLATKNVPLKWIKRNLWIQNKPQKKIKINFVSFSRINWQASWKSHLTKLMLYICFDSWSIKAQNH